ncbi:MULTISPECIES: diadenylate cyclase [Halobacteriales]|uniref:Diadenylate cyclase n=3 Tax=Halobacteriales TaxID=2235 RepID=A0A8U0I1Z1_9EURY|nr:MULTISPECIES: diadenylate cyclase [Halobacteriales]UPV77063.1 diadenylate cyclase [Halorussus limi]
MSEPDADPLRVEYTTVGELIDFIIYAIEDISLEFERWGEEHVRGPGLYFVVVAGVHSGAYADPLGENVWPTETCRVVTENLDGFVQAARTVGHSRDGAVVVSTDGTIQEQMVRIKSPNSDEAEAAETIEYADWMGTKHLSAIEVSVREEVVAAVTLSEEDGRMTLFEDGDYNDYQRDELGGEWRPSG